MKNSTISKRTLSIIPIALIMLMALSFVPVTRAYGGGALYQVTVSNNCNNASQCGGSTGGDWGWCALYADGTADCQITGYGKLPGTGAGPHGHISLDVSSWSIAPCTPGAPLLLGCLPNYNGNDFYFNAGTATIVGTPGSSGTTIDMCLIGFCGDAGIPSTPGHYSVSDLLGEHIPGIHTNIQVSQHP